MKKALVVTLLIITVMSFAHVLAEGDLGIQIIGDNLGDIEAVSLDDIKINTTYTISGYATITPISFDYVDSFSQYTAGKGGDNSIEYNNKNDPVNVYTGFKPGYVFVNMKYQLSGDSADFAQLKVDLTNLSKKPTSFMKDAKVTVYYNDDEYEFAGWVRQYDYDVNNRTVRWDWTETGAAAITPQDEIEIATMYTGHYVFGCTLPTAVINGTESLKMVIELGDSELTYNIRK